MRHQGLRQKMRKWAGSNRSGLIIQHGTTLALLVMLSATARADLTEVTPRWGHAAAYLPSPPTLLIQGGKTDPSTSYTYSNSPNTGEMLTIPLSSGFSTSSPPFTSLNLPSAPTSAWHSLTPLSASDGTWTLLSFGGDGGTSQAVQTGVDSAWKVEVNPAGPAVDYARQDDGSGQPMRRIYHSAASDPEAGRVFITGGLKADGSGSTFSEAYSYDASTSSFSALPNLPVGLYHHSSILLPNGTLLAMGGAYTSPSTGSPALQPYSTIYRLDTSSASPTWQEHNLGGELPGGRRGASMVISEEGTKAFLFGGADAGLAQVYGDGWELDLEGGSWSQVATGNEGAGPRFDHTAVAVGGNQVIIFGGYADGEPADANIHVWDRSSNSWASAFAVASALSSTSASSAAASTGKSGVDSATSGTGATLPGTKTSVTTGLASGSESTPSGVVASSGSGSPSDTSAPTDAGAHSHPLTTPIRVALIVGILAFVATIFGLCFWRYMRRKRLARKAGLNGSWPASGPRGRVPSSQYGLQTHGDRGDGLLEKLVQDRPDHANQSQWGNTGNGTSIGLGMGALGASLASFSSKIGARRQAAQDPYAELHDEPAREDEKWENLRGPLRKPTRKVGNGIRLLGPRVQREKSLYHSPGAGASARTASMIRESRIDMFREEDSPRYAIGQTRRDHQHGEDGWVIPCDESESKWKSAKSLLNARDSDLDTDVDRDPFQADDDDDYDDDAPILPPVRGGPVPTPHQSGTDLGMYDEIASMSNPYSELSRNPYSDLSRDRSMRSDQHSMEYQLPSFSPSDPLDLAGLLAPPNAARYSQLSFPNSQRSGRSGLTGRSNALSDAEEGIVYEAHATHLHSESPNLVSPGSPESSPQPIKRSESFFRRMAAGGITSLLPSRTASLRKKEQDIRDPAPQPTLWPIMSSENVNENAIISPISSSTESRHPPTSWKRDVLQAPETAHGKGPSLSSLNSARSMRDMIIVQRETTDSSVETEGVIERSSPPHEGVAGISTFGGSWHKQGPATHRGQVGETAVSPVESEGGLDISSEAGSQRHPDGADTPTPEESVFDGAEFASPITLPDVDFGPTCVPALDQVLAPVTTPALDPQPSNLARDESQHLRTKQAEQTTESKAEARHASSVDTQENADQSPSSIPPVTPKQKRRVSSLLSSGTSHPTPSSPSPSSSSKPSPTPYTSRRPVKDVVNSINRRGGSMPFTLLSPISNYTPAWPKRVDGDLTGASSAETGEDPFASPLDLTPTGRRVSTEVLGRTSGTPTATPRGRRETIHESPSRSTSTHGSSGAAASARERVISPTPGTRLALTGKGGEASPGRPKTMWEVIKREQGLRVTNPDSSEARKL